MTTTVKPAPAVALDIARNPLELAWLRLFRQIPKERRAEALDKLKEIMAMTKSERAAALARFVGGLTHV